MLKNIFRGLIAATAVFAAFTLGLAQGQAVVEPAPASIAEAPRSTPTATPSQDVADEVEPAETLTQEEPEEPVEVEPAVQQPTARPLKTAEDVAKTSNETVFKTMETQGGVKWSLDLLDGVRDGSYTYISNGAGVRIYIVDTGVDATHREFGSRVVDGFDAFGDNLDQSDCHGHGTHVAAIAAGNYYGVAKAATIVPVRVLDCSGVGNTTTLTEGIDWILACHGGGFGIVNMSLGGSRDAEVDALTKKLISAGLVVVAAAGNSNADACNYSPAGASGVIAVGAVDKDEQKASFSNWGSCVDVSAPGVEITSANSLDHYVAVRRSGTSQASPFVAGAIATYLSNKSITTSGQAQAYLQKISVNGVVRTDVEQELPVEPTPEPIVEPEPVAPEPEPLPSPIVDEPIVPEFEVWVEQVSPGSNKGALNWSAVPGAEAFEIHKTSSTRPGWRLWDVVPGDAKARVVIDKPGTIALYKVIAVIGSEKIELGTFTYQPES